MRFDKNGNPTPYGIILMEFNEFKEVFVGEFPESKTRSQIFECYKSFMLAFIEEIHENCVQWTDGSFTTNKLDPNDIDIVSFLNFDILNSIELSTIYKFISTKNVNSMKLTHYVHSFAVPIYPENDPRVKKTNRQKEYWKKWFGTDKKGNQKGIVQLELNRETINDETY